MAASITGGGGVRILYTNPTRHYLPLRPQALLPLPPRRALHVVVSAKKLPRTGRFDSKNRRNSTTTTTDQERNKSDGSAEVENVGVYFDEEDDEDDDDFVMPKLPGTEPDFWEGPQWDGLGFFVQYLWAFGIVFALIACIIAAATYNQGATDFKETPVYKESIQSRELLEEPEESNSDVFESNPTEVAPSLE